MKVTFFVVVGILLLFLFVLYLGQGRLIYFPGSYSAQAKELKAVETVAFTSGKKVQQSFLFPVGRKKAPKEVWWLFGGNGSLALNWVDLVNASGLREDQVFVLFDYPGYGLSEGKPSNESITRSVDDAFPIIADRLGLSADQLRNRSRSIGHSLGAAVALDTASRYDFSEVVMISPFTTMREMAKRQVGSFFALFLAHDYDNQSALERWMALPQAKRLTIFHGDRDRLIPISMSRELVEQGADPERITFLPVPEAGHNDIVMRIAPVVVKIVVE